MNDVLLLTMLRALDRGDTDTADECVSLASDPEAVAALLEDSVQESFTESEYETLSEAARAGLVKKQVGTHPRTGKPIVRWVRAQPKVSGKDQKAASVAKAKQTAIRLVRDGVRTTAQARKLADSLKQLSTADIDQLKRDFSARTGGKLKQDKVDRLVAYAQGRGSVTTPSPVQVSPATPSATVITPDTLATEIDRVGNEQYNGRTLIPIHAVRAAIRAKYGEVAASHEAFDEMLHVLRRGGKYRLVPVSDRSRHTDQQLKDGIDSAVGTLFYVERVK